MTVANNSTTDGYLRPSGPGPLEGDELLDFIQEWIVGITGLPGDMVRPSYQSEPPNSPDAGVVWAAFRIGATDADTFPYVSHGGVGDGDAHLQMHERMELLASFYDLGSGGEADKFAMLLRDGSAIEQNALQLRPAAMALVAVGNLTTVPVLLKQRWLYRVDLPMRLARQVNRTYPVFSVTSMGGELVTDVGLPPRDISVPNP